MELGEKRLLKLYERIVRVAKENSKFDEVECSLEEFFAIDELTLYNFYCSFANNHNISTLYDIGCGYGFQREVVRLHHMDYIGIDKVESKYVYGRKKDYIFKQYPFPIRTKKPSMAVSNLCLGFFNRKNIKETSKILSKDFTYFSCEEENIHYFLDYYDEYWKFPITYPHNGKSYVTILRSKVLS